MTITVYKGDTATRIDNVIRIDIWNNATLYVLYRDTEYKSTFKVLNKCDYDSISLEGVRK